jgi:HK97 family phage major capsid protein
MDNLTEIVTDSDEFICSQGLILPFRWEKEWPYWFRVIVYCIGLLYLFLGIAKIADIFSRRENTAFITGNGVGQPRGILTYAAGTNWGQIQQINSGTNGAVTADGIINLFYALKDEYSKRANFIMNRTVVQAVRLLKQATTNQYMWQPGLAAGAPDTLMGVPVFMATDMPVAANNALSIAVGDFQSAYQIVDRKGISILRDPFTEKPFVKFYATKRVGGDVVNFEAIKLMKLAV